MIKIEYQPRGYRVQFFKEFIKAEKLYIKTLFNALVTETPVDTGLAQASWHVGSANSVAPKLLLGNYERPPTPNLDFMDSRRENVSISNTADHIVYLNEGTSKQAPAKFVETTIDRISRKFQ